MPLAPWAAAALIGAAGSVVSNIWNAREAEKNRQFQERMSSTAHGREVADLKRSGLNPLLSRMGSGASSPGGDRAQMEDVGRGATSAMQARMISAQLELTRAQEQKTVAETQGIVRQNQELHSGSTDRLDLLRAQAEFARGTVTQQRELMPSILAKAQEEVSLVANSARAAKARALLDEAAETGALNQAEFEKVIGEAGPWVKFLLNALNAFRRPR